MKVFSSLLPAILAAAACAASTPAIADDLLGLYAGAGIGESTVRSDEGVVPGYGYYDHDHHTAWQAVVGIKPLPFVGAELEYIDFGHPGSDDYSYNNGFNYGPDSHPRALAAFAVGHVPLPLPLLDLYGKLGAARLHTNVDGFDGPSCPAYGPCQASAALESRSEWDTRLAYGVGLQSRFWSALTLRAEYQRISSPYGDPDMFSVAATWTF